MKNLLVIVVLLIGMTLVSFSSPLTEKVLSLDLNLGRTSNVLAGTLMIRYKAGYSSGSQVFSFSSASSYKIVSTFLPNSRKISLQKERLAKMSSAQKAELLAAEEKLSRSYIIEFDASIPPEKFAEQLLRSNPSIEVAEPYYINKAQYSPNDIRFGEQYLFKAIQAIRGYDISKGSEDVVIAISDNGVDNTHPDYQPNIAINENEVPDDGIDNDGNGYVDDYAGCNLAWSNDQRSGGDTRHSNSHGTQVAGIASAATDNMIGIAGVGFRCRTFPIKIAPYYSGSLIYAYQSIMYAAERGFQVVNCSWGTVKPYSQIEQSIIDYALSAGTSVVVAGGNLDDSIDADRYSVYYPAAYNGVLAVGESTENDAVVYGNTLLAYPVRIMAPGLKNISFNNFQGYETLNVGTSYASPVVAGVLGVVRSFYPNLTARQASEWVRINGDDITAENFTDTELIPRRVNLYKALSNDPMSLPALSIEQWRFYSTGKVRADRFRKGDTVLVALDIKNHLGKANNLRFSLSVAYSFLDEFIVLDSVFTLESLDTDSIAELAYFSFIDKASFKQKCIFRIDISADDGYQDFVKFEYNSGSSVTTFTNGLLTYSVGDAGYIGYTSDRKEGIGFAHYALGNQLFRGGIMATMDDAVVFSSIYGSGSDQNDFNVIKQYVNPDKYTATVEANGYYAGIQQLHPVACRISTTHGFLSADKPISATKIVCKNIEYLPASRASVGFFLDWDISPKSSNNVSGSLPQAIPFKYLQNESCRAQFITNQDSTIWVGSIAVPYDSYTGSQHPYIGKAQVAGIDMDFVYNNGFSEYQQILSLHSADFIQDNNPKDMAYVVGMRFFSLESGDEAIFYIFTAIAQSKSELISLLKEAADNPTLSINDTDKTNLSIFPNPAQDKVEFVNSEMIKTISIINLLGETIYRENLHVPSGSVQVDISGLSNGIYTVVVETNGKSISNRLVVAR